MRKVEAHEEAFLGHPIGYPLCDAFRESPRLPQAKVQFLWVWLQLPDHRWLSSPNLWIDSGILKKSLFIFSVLTFECTLQIYMIEIKGGKSG